MFIYLLIITDPWWLNSIAVHQADLAFGREQVATVIRDRPDMGVVINREPALRTMLEWSFGGQYRSKRTYWEPYEPQSGQRSEISKIFVRVTNKPTTSAVDKCATLVFELQSIQLNKEWKTLNDAARAGTIRRDAYAVSCVCLEYQALTETQKYFAEHPLKDANTKDNPFYRNVLGLHLSFSDYLKWLEGLDPEEYNPLKYFGDSYDKRAGSASEGVSRAGGPKTTPEVSAEELLKD